MADRRGTALNATRSILSEIFKDYNYLKFHTVQFSVIHYQFLYEYHNYQASSVLVKCKFGQFLGG